MKKFKLILVILFFTGFQIVISQPAADWSKLQHLTGHWVGEGNGKPGQGTGGFSFQPDLGGNILVRKSHTEFPATSDRPATTHDDFKMYLEGKSKKL